MTIDAKYANLPWMAGDESDVYETQDLPECEQVLLQVDDTSIESINIKLEDAMKVFAGSTLNSDDVDFSDRIRGFVNTGYSFDTSEYVLYPELQRNLETNLERFQRLQHEVRDLMDDFEGVKSLRNKDAECQLKNNELLSMGKELESMTNQLGCYKLHCSLGDENAVNVAIDGELCGQQNRDMMEEIERYTSKYKKNDAGGDKLSWEKYYQSPLAKELDGAKISDLNQRVQRLEATLGYGERDLNLTSLNADTATKSLADSVKILMSRCQPLIGGPNVDKIESRLIELTSKLQSVTEKGEIIKEADCQNKIAELFNLVEKWKEFRHVLPVVVKRLEDLQELHNQAIHFSDSTNFMDKNQKEMKKNMAQHKEMLTKVESQLGENVKKIRERIGAMQTRVDKL